MEEKWNITKLNGKNWNTWKFQIRHLLLAKELWGYVDGTEVLDDTASEQLKVEFKRKVQKAYSSIVLSISEEYIYLITQCEKPFDVWKTLRGYFERETLANKLFLKKKYYRSEMKDGTTIDCHLREMKELTDRLASIGAPIPEEDQVVTLLGSLPKSYASLVTALEMRVDDATLNFVQQALVNEEQKRLGHSLVEKQSAGVSEDTALVGAYKQGNFRNPIKCYNCGANGHMRRECRKPKREYAYSRESFSTHNAKTAEEKNQSKVMHEETFVAISDTIDTSIDRWVVDSGASAHMTCHKDILCNYSSFDIPQKVGLGDGRTVDVVGTGTVKIAMLFDNYNTMNCEIENVLYVPKLSCNLFSVKSATNKGKVVQFGHSKCWIRDANGKLCGTGSLVNKMYQLNCETISQKEYASVASADQTGMDLWHQRLGHTNGQRLKEISEKDSVSGLNIQKKATLSFCEGCVEGKMQRQPFKPVGEIRSTRKLELIHSDVCGPMQTASMSGRRYFVTFIDDYTRYCKVYFMEKKSEVFEKFKEFEIFMTNSSGLKIGSLRSDNGGEYVSAEFENYLKSKGIHHELTVAYTPQQNGVAERMNRTLMESSRSMLSHAGLPNSYWAEAVATAAYIRNRISTSAYKEQETPYERWYERKPSVHHMKVFGCMAYAHVPDEERRKLDKKAERFRFVGYSTRCKGYRLLNEATKKIIVKRDVNFNEKEFKPPAKTEVSQEDSVELETNLESLNDQQETQSPRSERQRKAPIRYGFDEYADTATQHLASQHTAYHISQIEEPTTIEEAMKSNQSEEWRQALNQEYESLMENDTWDLVELPPDRKAINCKWVFKAKQGSNGQIERFKGRLVAKGFSQKYGLDYDETFAPVVRLSSVRTLLAFAIQNDMHIHQMDVVTAFLNGELDEEIYMQQPVGYIIPGKENLVCKLKKSLYGLKQSPRCWNKIFVNYMKSIDFKQSEADSCIFIKNYETLNVVAVYVDDLIVITKTEEAMITLKSKIESRFKMKDMGKLHYCLGISIVQDEEKKILWMHQEQYILKLIEKFGQADAQKYETPSDLNVKLVKEDNISKPTDQEKYQSIVGSLLYAAMATRPDIAQAVGVISKFCSCPNESHMTAAKRILRYLNGTSNLALKFQKSGESLCGYADADWAGDQDDRRSTTGNLFMMADGPVSWLSKKQATVALSTSEAEYVAVSIASQEAIWLRRLLKDLGIDQGKPTPIMEDNQGAIAMSRNPIGHARTKHIDIRYHFIREQVQEGTISLHYCPTENMIADLLTKAIPKEAFLKFKKLMGMKTI